MRRKKQSLSEEEITTILNRETSGILALLGDYDYPYAIPISYVEKEWEALCIIEFSIEYLSGKEAIELVQARE